MVENPRSTAEHRNGQYPPQEPFRLKALYIAFMVGAVTGVAGAVAHVEPVTATSLASFAGLVGSWASSPKGRELSSS